MSDLNVQYRRADLADMRRLNGVFAEAFEDVESYASGLPSDEYLAAMLDRDDVIPLVAATGPNEIIGGLVAYVLRKMEQERSEIYIYDLAVSARFRRRGVATGLINSLRGMARAMGAWVVYVQADTGDDPAIKLYESLGTREDVHHFDIMPEE